MRDFARAMGLDAKTDRVDAQVIAKYGQITDPRATTVLPPEREKLAELLACRRQLVDEITVRQQQLEHLHRTRTVVIETIDYLISKRKELDNSIDALVAAHDALQALLDLMLTMPGCRAVGPPQTARGSPTKHRLGTGRQGQRPPKNSGRRENQRVTKGGRGRVRRILYVATISAIRANDNRFKARYLALVGRGKAKKSSSPPSCAP